MDVQISLLSEQEITKLVHMISDIAERLGVDASAQPDVEEMKGGVPPRPSWTLSRRANGSQKAPIAKA